MIKAGVIGATGYAGAILIRILKKHPMVESIMLGSRSYVGDEYSSVYESFKDIEDTECVEGDMNQFADACDVVFLALPHGVASKDITEEVLSKTKVIDLGADFRIKNIDVYEKWYNTKHYGENMLEKAVYGLPEIHREDIKNTRLVANPGCYTTCSILSLVPLLAEELINEDSIIVDAKSGVTGAGRGVNRNNLYCEVNENFKAYGITNHRHTPEIEQEISKAAGKDVIINFTPHLVPMNRGILTTIYADLKDGTEEADIKNIYKKYYKDEYFVRLREGSDSPQTKFVKGSNYFDLSFVIDPRTNRIVITSVIDNLYKGAASQAVQNMNILFNYDEKEGIDFIPEYL